MNVFSFGADVSSFRANVSSFWPNVFSFEGDVSTLAGDVSSFWRGALVGDGARTEGEIRSFGKLRTGFDGLRAGSRGTSKWSDGGLGMVGRSGRHWCAGIDRGAGSRPGTPG